MFVTVNFLSESCKWVFGTLLYLGQKKLLPEPDDTTVGEDLSKISCKEFLLYAVPGFIYMIDNNLMFVILNYVDPPTVSVLWNIKILITAVLFKLTFKKSFTRQKWFSVTLLLVGCVATLADKMEKKNGVCNINGTVFEVYNLKSGCTTAPLHHCTTAPLHHSTTAPLHHCCRTALFTDRAHCTTTVNPNPHCRARGFCTPHPTPPTPHTPHTRPTRPRSTPSRTSTRTCCTTRTARSPRPRRTPSRTAPRTMPSACC